MRNSQSFNVKFTSPSSSRETLKFGDIAFTPREVDVAACLLSGRSVKSVALLLALSPRTIETYIRTLLQKTFCTSREEIIGLIEKSSLYEPLKEHYKYLLRDFEKQKVLEKIKRHIKQGALDIQIITQGDKTTPLAHQLVKDFESLGTKVTPSPRTNFTEKNLETRDYFLIASSKNLEDHFKIDVHLSNVTKREKFESPSKNLSYHEVFFGILKSLFKDPQITKAIESFLKTNPPLDPFKLEERLEKQDSGKKSAHGKKQLWQYSWKILGLCGVLFLSLFLYFKDTNKDILSNLYSIPTHKLLVRANQLSILNQKLKPHGNQNSLVAIVGIGGSGKTTLARTYAQRWGGTLMWEINAKDKKSILHSLEEIALIFASLSEKNQEIYSQMFKQSMPTQKDFLTVHFVNKMLHHQKNWVLIFDDLKADTGTIHTLLPLDPEISGHGKIIITSRDANIQLGIDYEKIITIPPLNAEEKRDLFKKINPKLKISKALLEEMPPFPLDISMAAHYVKSVHVPLLDYLDRIRISKDLEPFQKTLLKHTGNYEKTRQNILNATIKDILKANKQFKILLLVISIIDSKEIPRYFLENFAPKTMVDDFIFHLTRHSLVTNMSKRNEIDVFSIHESVQKGMFSYMQDTCSKEFFEKTIEKLVDLLTPIFKTWFKEQTTPRSISKEVINIYHTKALLKLEALTLEQKADLMTNLGHALLYSPKLKESETLFLNASRFYKKQKTFEKLLTTYACLGVFYILNGRTEKAQQTFNQGLTLQKSKCPNNLEKKAYLLIYLGHTYQYLGRYSKALKALLTAKKIYEKLNYLSRVNSAKGCLAILYNEMGKYETSKRIIEESFEFFKKSKNFYAMTWFGIAFGNALFHLGKLDEAREILEGSYKYFEQHSGKNHPNTVYAAFNLALVYAHQKKFKAARTLLKDACQYRYNEHTLHPQLGKIYYVMGITEFLDQKINEAEDFFKKSLKIFNLYNHPKASLSKKYLKKIESSYKERTKLAPRT